MTAMDDKPSKKASERAAEERKARAAQKLRENLMRRKQQSRARRKGAADETDGLPAAGSRKNTED